jgi:hypothetical protein
LRKEALDRKLELQELGRIFFLINQRRGLQEQPKGGRQGRRRREEADGLQAGHERFRGQAEGKRLAYGGRVPSLLFDDQPANWHNENEPRERIREHQRIKRELYQAGVRPDLGKQSSYYPAVLTATELKEELRDKVIFFQRKLKSAKHLVSKCRFEPNKRVMAKSDPLFQEFRMWQRLRDIRVTYGDRVNDPLTNDERGTLAAELGGTASLSKTEIKDLLGFKRSATFNDIGEKLLKGMSPSHASRCCGRRLVLEAGPEKRLKLWHTLYFARRRGVDRTHIRTEEPWHERRAGQALCGSERLELDYGSISHKAAQKILPLLIDGLTSPPRALKAGYHHSQRDLDKARTACWTPS